MFVLLPQTCVHVISIFLDLFFNFSNFKYFKMRLFGNIFSFVRIVFGITTLTKVFLYKILTKIALKIGFWTWFI